MSILNIIIITAKILPSSSHPLLISPDNNADYDSEVLFSGNILISKVV